MSEAVDSLPADTVSNITDTTVQAVDFASAFDSTLDIITDSCSDSTVAIDSPVVSLRYPSYKVVKRDVRIALERNIFTASFFCEGKLQIRSASMVLESCKGAFTIQSRKNGNVLISCGYKTAELVLPCTLITRNSSGSLKVNKARYRGSIVLLSEKQNFLSVINIIDVEEYLRGVVPLEIGKRPESLIEALKAQAVAARTYTYKRMQERRFALFDMTATVQDQVYGGIEPEYRESDMAIKMTADLILVSEDSIVNAYYHSTCGGKTANIEDVWNRDACRYLKSIDDVDSSGQPYCSISPRFSWHEKWPTKLFFNQISSALQRLYPEKDFRGVTSLTVKDLFSCGRVKTCTFANQKLAINIGGDKLRFIIRRDTPERSILRSANFTIVSVNSKDVLINGTGYGHGVGMCQMGAIGRAQSGQKFDTILKAYYSGVNIFMTEKK